MRNKNHVLIVLNALTLGGCSTTILHANYEFGGASATFDRIPLELLEVAPQTFAASDGRLTIALRPDAEGVVVALTNHTPEVIVIDWKKSELLLADVSSWPLPVRSASIERGKLVDRIEPRFVASGRSVAERVAPWNRWYVHHWSQSAGDTIYHYEQARVRPLLTVKHHLARGENIERERQRLESRLNEPWTLRLHVLHGPRTAVYELRVVVRQAKVSHQTINTY